MISIAGGRGELSDYAIHSLRHLSPETIIWTSEKEVRDVLAGVLPGSNVRLCREDGWPSDYCNDAVFVRTVNSPPPLPISTFCHGELVLSKFQLDTLAEGVVGSC